MTTTPNQPEGETITAAARIYAGLSYQQREQIRAGTWYHVPDSLGLWATCEIAEHKCFGRHITDLGKNVHALALAFRDADRDR